MITEGQELEIPVPWGHIAGKFWGNFEGRRLLLVHGRQDNCGVFDRIIPLLQGDYYIITIDLPGHGLSSHFPEGVPLDFLNFIIAIYCVVEYIQWKKFLFLGHSFGGKSWGNSNAANKVLLVHGILHNCASFNKLIPLLLHFDDYYWVAIDLPGHGFSSHFPAGFPLDFFNFVHSIKRLVDNLNWKRFIYLGHSYGGVIGIYFTSLFSDYVESLMVIDTMEPRPVPLNDTLSHLQLVLSEFYKLDEKLSQNDAPVYTYEEVFKKTKQNWFWPLDDQAAKDLLERSVKPFKNGYCFVNDQRLKLIIRPVLTFEQQRMILDNIVCPVMFILADQNMERYGTYLKEIYEYNQSKSNCTIVQVAGDHSVHQNFPERVSGYINEFLSNNATP